MDAAGNRRFELRRYPEMGRSATQFTTRAPPRRALVKGYDEEDKSNPKMTTLTEQEVQRNMRAVAHAIGQQELEGLKVPEFTVVDLRRAARGEIDTDEVIRNIHRRFKNVPIFRS
jgi:hypothetical protein